MDAIKNFIKKISIWGWFVVASAIFAFIGLIIYGVTSTTGYLPSVGQSWSVLPLILSLLAVLASCAIIFKEFGKSWINTIVLFAIVSLLIASFALFVSARITNFADCYFVPLAPPADEVALMNSSIAGIIFYILSIASIIVAAFGTALHKENN